MYRKIKHMFGMVMGHRIEDCIMVYTNYMDKKGAISVIIGDIIKSDTEPTYVSDSVAQFL